MSLDAFVCIAAMAEDSTRSWAASVVREPIDGRQSCPSGAMSGSNSGKTVPTKSTTRIMIGAVMPSPSPSNVMRIKGGKSKSEGIEQINVVNQAHARSRRGGHWTLAPIPSNPARVGQTKR